MMQKRGRYANILFWSIISAAFIGPGTVATAAGAGARFGAALIWALVFSTIATIILQETAARLTITTGKNLGEHIREANLRRLWIPAMVWGIVAFGCAAYEAGNILGAVAGASVVIEGRRSAYTILIAGCAFILLLTGNIKLISRILGCVVALMGMAFAIVAVQTEMAVLTLIRGAFVPVAPTDSLILVIALIGTTIVPYNLFLGSGISHGQDLRSMRFGLTIAILIGGAISIAILIVGARITGTMDFDVLADVLQRSLGVWARYVFGIGLLAAGLTSAITAPLAAAVTARSVFPAWKEGSMEYKAVWMTVLGIGFGMSLLNLRPIPVIIAAQALNGMLLPVVTIALFDIALRRGAWVPPTWYVVLTILVLGVVTFLGANSLLAALDKGGLLATVASFRWGVALVCGGVATVWAGWRVFRM